MDYIRHFYKDHRRQRRDEDFRHCTAEYRIRIPRWTDGQLKYDYWCMRPGSDHPVTPEQQRRVLAALYPVTGNWEGIRVWSHQIEALRYENAIFNRAKRMHNSYMLYSRKAIRQVLCPCPDRSSAIRSSWRRCAASRCRLWSFSTPPETCSGRTSTRCAKSGWRTSSRPSQKACISAASAADGKPVPSSSTS